MKTIHSMLLGVSLTGLMATSAMAGPLEITTLGTIKTEVAKPFEAAVNDYNASQDKYVIKAMPLASTTNAFSQMSTLYASGNAPAFLTMGQEAAEFKDRLMDLSGTDLAQQALPNTLNVVTDGDKVYGVPVTIEAFGFIYNKAVLDEAVGGSFDPDSIKTKDDLVALFDAIKQNTDAAPLTISPMDWSLGAHFTNVYFTNAADDLSGKLDVLAALEDGSYDLKTDETFGEWLDMFDLMMANNLHSDSPLSPTYDDGALDLATGEAGLWFQGNWTYPLLKEISPDTEFGILPVPLNNDAEDTANTAISVGVPLFYVVDEFQSTPEERAGSLDFLDWLFLSDKGADYCVNEMDFLPVYSGVNMQPQNSLSQMILKYAEEGRSLDWVNIYYPADAFPAMGASLQKYLAGVIDRDGLADEFEEYWATN
jgi:raffinose/stachyose/melibiose transport system substrate-binding protein